MATYVVQWRYQSSAGGPWGVGAEVELPDEVAMIVNNSSPGVLLLKGAATSASADVSTAEPDVDTGDSPETEGGQEPGAGQRQVTAARNRALTRKPRTNR